MPNALRSKLQTPKMNLGREITNMSEKERLQKAIETTLTTGYQLSTDAFDYLCHCSKETDPLTIMNMVLHEINLLKEKP
jgi:hypothetical protein